MELYFLFVVVGCVLFTGALVGLVWLIRSGQLDDLETPALRMLADEEQLSPTTTDDEDRSHV